MPKWVPQNQDTRVAILLIGIGLLVVLITTIYGVQVMNSTLDAIDIVNLTGLIFLSITMIARGYLEYNSKNDFINLTRSGIFYRESPKVGFPFLPKTGHLEFEEIQSIDIVELSSILSTRRKSIGLLITQKLELKPLIIGTRLEYDQIFKIALALKGSVTFAKGLSNLIGKDVSEIEAADVVDAAQKLWASFRQSRKSGGIQ